MINWGMYNSIRYGKNHVPSTHKTSNEYHRFWSNKPNLCKYFRSVRSNIKLSLLNARAANLSAADMFCFILLHFPREWFLFLLGTILFRCRLMKFCWEIFGKPSRLSFSSTGSVFMEQIRIIWKKLNALPAASGKLVQTLNLDFKYSSSFTRYVRPQTEN